jgi:hypothetical protein
MLYYKSNGRRVIKHEKAKEEEEGAGAGEKALEGGVI